MSTKSYIKYLTVTLLLSLSLILTSKVGLTTELKNNSDVPKEKELPVQQEDTQDANRWTETLRLKDFYLSPTFLETRNNIKTYRDTLSKNYLEHPDVFSAAVEYGLLLIDLGELDKAKTVWERATKDFRSNQIPQVYKAWADASCGDYLAAKTIWYPIVRQKLDIGFNNIMWFAHQVDAILGLYLIKDYLPPTDKEEVETLINEVAKNIGPHPKLSTILISRDLQAGKLNQADERATRIITMYPGEAIFATLLGIKNLLDGKYEEALKLFDKANLINPDLPTNHLMRARTLAALKRKKESNVEIEQAMRLDPSWNPKKQKISKLLAPKSYVLLAKKQAKKSKAEEEAKEPKLPNVPESL